jgi:hypothetical protein
MPRFYFDFEDDDRTTIDDEVKSSSVSATEKALCLKCQPPLKPSRSKSEAASRLAASLMFASCETDRSDRSLIGGHRKSAAHDQKGAFDPRGALKKWAVWIE